jgi:uncharacterized protein
MENQEPCCADTPAEQNRKAICYANQTDGYEQNYQKAVELFTLAANQGDSYAQYNLGDLYMDGLGVCYDKQKAIELYCSAAKSGIPEAQERMAFCYLIGDGVDENEEKAMELYTLAANAGNAMAQHFLGVSYAEG